MERLTPSEIIASMRKVALFSALDDSQLRQLLDICPARSVPKGSLIFSPSQPAEQFYVILSGEIKVYKLSAGGDEQILHLYGKGKTFGEAAMWAKIRYPAHAEAIGDSTLLAVGRAALKNMLERNADIALAMLAGMSSKLREFNHLIEQLSLKEVPARLAGILLELPAEGAINTVVLEQTKQQLAARIGTIPETLSRALKKLKDMGLIEVDGRKITILDPDSLAELADG